jgi:hypothetical protein
MFSWTTNLIYIDISSLYSIYPKYTSIDMFLSQNKKLVIVNNRSKILAKKYWEIIYVYLLKKLSFFIILI